MPRGKMRSEAELRDMVRNLRRKHRPLQRRLDDLRLMERTLDWANGGDDPLAELEEPQNNPALDLSDAEEVIEAE
jgi:hypothetical protein